MSADWRIIAAGLVFLLALVLFMNMETYIKDSKNIVTINDGKIETLNTDVRNNEIMAKFDKISKAIEPGNRVNFHLREWYPNQPNPRHTQSGHGARCIHGGRGRCHKRGECRTSVECPQGLIPWDLGRDCTCAYARQGGHGGFTFKAD